MKISSKSGPTETSEELEAAAESFRRALLDSVEMVTEFGVRISLRQIEDFEPLADTPEIARDIFFKEFGFDESFAHQLEVGREQHEGSPDSPAEGQIEVIIYRTSRPDVFIGKYTYPDGSVDWSIRPLLASEIDEF